MLLYSLAITAQTEVIAKGVVVDENNEPIIGANIAVKGNKSIGIIADLDGNFQLKVPSSNSILVVSFIGMTTKEVKVETAKSIKIVLQADNVQLQEVVVGFGQQKKASVVGAIAQTNSKALERTGGVTSLGQALTGNLPGVVTMTTTGKPGDEDPKITIRGVTSWNSSDPLVLVDG
ncbi:MAG TPA: carboxypeptidase-like regulatory domain-containing protein, partial [Bacteroides graminisolvens]|nr:carboxypeptidase-like regulatory domain-containing protein [Bacteroides graminisolvens]